MEECWWRSDGGEGVVEEQEMAGWWIRQEKRWQYEEVLRVWGTRGVIPLFKLNSVILEKKWVWEKGSLFGTLLLFCHTFTLCWIIFLFYFNKNDLL